MKSHSASRRKTNQQQFPTAASRRLRQSGDTSVVVEVNMRLSAEQMCERSSQLLRVEAHDVGGQPFNCVPCPVLNTATRTTTEAPPAVTITSHAAVLPVMPATSLSRPRCRWRCGALNARRTLRLLAENRLSVASAGNFDAS